MPTEEQFQQLLNRVEEIERKQLNADDLPPHFHILDKIHVRDIRGNIGALITEIDASGDLRGRQLIADGDNAGTASTTTLTNATDTPTTDPGWTTSSTVNMNAPDGYLKLYQGTQEITVPFWNT